MGLEQLSIVAQRRLLWTVLFVVSLARVILWFIEASGPLPDCARNQSVELLGEVQQVRDNTPFQTVIVRVQGSDCGFLVGQRVRLSNRLDIGLRQDEQIAAVTKLKRPWGSVNPGGFNYRLWLLGQNIAAVGYITSFKRREETRFRESEAGLTLVNEPLLRAIALGDRSGVAEEDWSLFRETGTVHMAIVSGLHVGVLAGLVHFVFSAITRVPIFGAGFRVPSIIASVTVVFGYAYVTGLEPPVIRAAVMFAVGALVLVSLRKASLLCVLGCVAVGLILAQPNLVLRAGYWLSFGAVAALVAAFEPRQRRLSWIAAVVAAQVAIFIAMTHTTSFFVGEAYLIAPIANLVVVPLMTILVIPLAMVGITLEYLGSPWSQLVLSIADFGLFVVMRTLEALSEILDLGVFDANFSVLLLGIPVCFLLFVPVSVGARLFLALGFLMLLLKVPSLPPAGEFSVSILDVGQGSAAIVSTNRHRLIADAGAAYESGFDAGRQIVLPALRATGPYRVDKIIVSHGDIDHIGGARAIRQVFPNADYVLDDACRNDDAWEWEGVRFTTQRIATASNPNDRSCAVVISNGHRTVYLPGDIGYSSELLLKSKVGRDIDLLAAPHHGSATSSHPAFVKQLAPTYVVFSAGFQNRYQHPATSVVARYARRRSILFWTYSSGAVEWSSWRRGVRVHRRELLGLYVPVVGEVDERS